MIQLRLNKREKTLALATALFLLGIVFFQFIYGPKKRGVITLQGELNSLDSRISEMKTSLVGVNKLRKDIPKLERALAFWRSKKQGKGDVAHFLNHLARESKKLGIKLSTIKPEEQDYESRKPKPPLSLYKRIRIDLRFQANYYTLSSYLQGLEEFPFYLTLNQLHIEGAGGQDQLGNLAVQMRLVIYLFSSPNDGSKRGGIS